MPDENTILPQQPTPEELAIDFQIKQAALRKASLECDKLEAEKEKIKAEKDKVEFDRQEVERVKAISGWAKTSNWETGLKIISFLGITGFYISFIANPIYEKNMREAKEKFETNIKTLSLHADSLSGIANDAIKTFKQYRDSTQLLQLALRDRDNVIKSSDIKIREKEKVLAILTIETTNNIHKRNIAEAKSKEAQLKLNTVDIKLDEALYRTANLEQDQNEDFHNNQRGFRFLETENAFVLLKNRSYDIADSLCILLDKCLKVKGDPVVCIEPSFREIQKAYNVFYSTPNLYYSNVSQPILNDCWEKIKDELQKQKPSSEKVRQLINIYLNQIDVNDQLIDYSDSIQDR